MPRRNLNTSLRRRRTTNPMRAYDRLPPDVRRWLAGARLPWSPQSVGRMWQAALRRCRGDRALALAELARAEDRCLARDAAKIWGQAYPHRL